MIYTFYDCEFDDALYDLRRNGAVVPLEPQVFRLLAYLLRHRERVVSRDELFEKLWPGQVVGDAALTYCIGKARKAVADTGSAQRIIKTVHGHGYRFVAEVRRAEADVTMRTPEVQAAPELIPVYIPSPFHTPSLLGATCLEKTQVTGASLLASRQSRQLTVVVCLFVCGWITSLWQAVQSRAVSP